MVSGIVQGFAAFLAQADSGCESQANLTRHFPMFHTSPSPGGMENTHGRNRICQRHRSSLG